MRDIQVGWEGDPLGGCEVLPMKTEVWDENKSKLFPLGQCIDCNRDSPPAKMLPLCSAPCVFVHVIAVRQFIQFSSTWHGFSANKHKVLPSCHGELCANRAEQRPLVHTHTTSVCCVLLLCPGACWEHDHTVLLVLWLGLVPLNWIPHSHQ